jgi:2',3'-cyclic-nucleotide 2'-phosphodiesterase (5'-nucleotidase family)
MPPTGGVARRATVISLAKQKDGNLLVLDAGNSLAFDSDPAKSSEGKTSVEAMNRMGYDAAAIGPLDLALGAQALAARMAEARFPFLSANAYDAASQERIAKPYVVREVGGHRVALVGLTGSGAVAGFNVADPFEAVSAVLPELRSAADVIVLLSTAGLETDKRIAESIPEIDVILAAGSPPLAGWARGGPFGAAGQPTEQGAPRFIADYSAPGHAGRHMGRATLRFSEDGTLARQSWERIKLGPEIADDPAMLAWMTEVEAGQ